MQTYFEPHMRTKLMIWILEVSSELRFQRQTCHVCLALIDGYFSKAQYLIPVSQFQLIGVCALWISAKLEEIYVPELKYFSQATGYSSTEREICEMERYMLRIFGYKVHKVTLQSWTEVLTTKWD